VKATGDKIKLVDYGGTGQARFEYYAYCSPVVMWATQSTWMIENIGAFGPDWYYSKNEFWFKDEHDLLLYTLRWST